MADRPDDDLQKAPTSSAVPAIEIEGLVKSFGTHRALDGMNLRVPQGQIAGFLGPNGAGKSTAIRVLLGLVHRDAGTVRILGTDPVRDAAAVHRRLAYVPGDVALWPRHRGKMHRSAPRDAARPT